MQVYQIGNVNQKESLDVLSETLNITGRISTEIFFS